MGGLLFRAWYYFRLGYSTYLTFILGYVSTLITVYYLAIKSIPYLIDLFPKFELFALLSTVVGVPLSVGVGWIHLKRSRLYSSETDIGVESNPYNYKLAPGYTVEVWGPYWKVTLEILRKLGEKSGVLNESDKALLEDLEKKIEILRAGGYVGKPRRTTNF